MAGGGGGRGLACKAEDFGGLGDEGGVEGSGALHVLSACLLAFAVFNNLIGWFGYGRMDCLLGPVLKLSSPLGTKFQKLRLVA